MSNVPEPGTTLGGKYLVDRVLGVGGMGVVVAATHVQLDQRVAIKFLLPEAVKNPEVVARFSREARAAAKIRGEHVARVIDVGHFDDGTPYMVMEHLEGHDLAKELELKGTLAVEDTVRYVLETCEALAEAHAAKVVHRDLKPSNMFLAEQPDKSAIIKVLDFGISKLDDAATAGLTKTSALMGTAFYMSPEQLTTPKDIDGRSDIWSLGVIMYELLTGKQPYAGELVPEIIAAILQNDPVPLASLRSDVPAGLVSVIERCLRSKAADRYANVAMLAAALAPFAAHEDRRSVFTVGRVLGVDVTAEAEVAPPSAVVRPVTAIPASAHGATTAGEASVVEPPPAPAAETTSNADVVANAVAGTVTTHGMSTSVAGVPKKRPGAAVYVAIAGVLAVAGIAFALRSKESPPPSTGIVGASLVASATSAASPPSGAPLAPVDTAATATATATATTTAATPAPPSTSATATAAVTAGVRVGPRTAVAPGVASAVPVVSAAVAPSPPASASSATNTSKNPLQMGIK